MSFERSWILMSGFKRAYGRNCVTPFVSYNLRSFHNES